MDYYCFMILVGLLICYLDGLVSFHSIVLKLQVLYRPIHCFLTMSMSDLMIQYVIVISVMKLEQHFGEGKQTKE